MATTYQVTSLPAIHYTYGKGNYVTHAMEMINYEMLEKGVEMIKGE